MRDPFFTFLVLTKEKKENILIRVPNTEIHPLNHN